MVAAERPAEIAIDDELQAVGKDPAGRARRRQVQLRDDLVGLVQELALRVGGGQQQIDGILEALESLNPEKSP